HDGIQRRQAMLYPPYTRLARLIIDSADAVRAEEASRWLGAVLPRRLPHTQHATRWGPAEAPIAKIKDRHRWHMLLKATSSRALHQWLKDTLAETHQERQQTRGTSMNDD